MVITSVCKLASMYSLLLNLCFELIFFSCFVTKFSTVILYSIWLVKRAIFLEFQLARLEYLRNRKGILFQSTTRQYNNAVFTTVCTYVVCNSSSSFYSTYTVCTVVYIQNNNPVSNGRISNDWFSHKVLVLHKKCTHYCSHAFFRQVMK